MSDPRPTLDYASANPETLWSYEQRWRLFFKACWGSLIITFLLIVLFCSGLLPVFLVAAGFFSPWGLIVAACFSGTILAPVSFILTTLIQLPVIAAFALTRRPAKMRRTLAALLAVQLIAGAVSGVILACVLLMNKFRVG
jgi:hypothetical protein